MFDVDLKSPSDGIPSGPLGGPRRATYGGDCKRSEEWGCYIMDDALAPYCECLSIYTCEPYDEPEHGDASDFLGAGGGGEEPE